MSSGIFRRAPAVSIIWAMIVFIALMLAAAGISEC